jgi:hypothetical protein
MTHLRFVLFAALILGLAACVTEQAPEVETSGFFPDYTILQSGGPGQPRLFFRNPEADFASYEKILLEPVTVWCSHESSLDQVPRRDVQRLVNQLHIAVARELAQSFDLVTTPGPRTLRIQIILTDAVKSRVPMDVLSTLVPIGRGISTVDRMATGTHAFVGSAAIELSVTDAETRLLLYAAVDRRTGGKAVTGVLRSWDDVEESFRVWAAQIHKGLLEEGLQANWNQERVQALAEDFERAIAALLAKARIEKREVSGDASATEYLIVEDLRLLHRHARRYAHTLASGRGRVESMPLFLRMMEIVRTTRSRAVASDLLVNSQTEIGAARAILGEIASYYGESLPPPVTPPAPEG